VNSFYAMALMRLKIALFCLIDPLLPYILCSARRMQYSQATSCLHASFASLLCLPLISQEFFSWKKFSIRIHYHQDFSNRIYLLFALQISPVIHNPKSSPRWTNFSHTQPHSTRPGGNSKSLLTDKRSNIVGCILNY
jgi:hypothetical protein